MAKKLVTHVHVQNPETGEYQAFGPDDALPKWAEDEITNPAAFEAKPNPHENFSMTAEEVADAGKTPARKKTTRRKTTAKRKTARKKTTRKTSARKSTAKKTTAKSTASKTSG